MTQPTAEALRVDIEALLGVPFYAEFDAKYPECLCAVVVGDVGPTKMEKVCDLIRKAGDEKLRLCANVIDDGDAKRVKALYASGGFTAAFAESWNISITTVRMG